MRNPLYICSVLLAAVVFAFFLSGCKPGGTPTPTPTPDPNARPGEITLGIASVAGKGNPELAQASGSTWDRVAFHWNEIELGPTDEDWSWATSDPYFESSNEPMQDVLAVLTNVPGVGNPPVLTPWHESPQGFVPAPAEVDPTCAAAYINGSQANGYCVKFTGLEQDPWLPDGQINKANRWAYFVYQVTSRYHNQVKAWQIYNEMQWHMVDGWDYTSNKELGRDIEYFIAPDHLLDAVEVAYKVIKQGPHGNDGTDPDAPIVLEGPFEWHTRELTYGGGSGWPEAWQKNWYKTLLEHLGPGGSKSSTAQYIDAIGLNLYYAPWRAFDYIQAVVNILNFPIKKDIWFSESGWANDLTEETSSPCNQASSCASDNKAASYLLQQYAYVVRAFKYFGIPHGMIFHFSFNDLDEGDRWIEGLVVPGSGTTRPSYYAFQFLNQKLMGLDPFIDEYTDNGTYAYMKFSRLTDNTRIFVIWNNTDTPEENAAIPAKGMGCVALFDQRGIQVDPTGNPSGECLTSVKGQFIIPLSESKKPGVMGGPTYTLIETAKDTQNPEVSVDWICPDDQSKELKEAALAVYDDLSGPAQLVVNTGVSSGQARMTSASRMAASSITASGIYTFDLSWLKSKTLYITTTNLIPAVGETWIYTVTDNADNEMVGEITNPDECPCPGGDNPDENFSAASVMSPSTGGTAVDASQHPPRVAVFNRGFAIGTLQLVLSQNEPAMFVDSDFDPAATYAKYPVLVIPSGGLYGLGDSPTFRARLEAYANLGGTLIVFDQQHGSDYAALPGGRVGGSGWDEDISCFVDAFYLAQYHPALAGFDHSRLSIHADGFFRTYPANSTILLRRSANGMPGAIVYPFGAGRVFATTIYDDWGIDNGQIGADASVLLRDLITWSTTPVIAEPGTPEALLGVPTFRVGETVAVTFSLTNTTSFTTTNVRLDLITPARELTATQTITLEIGPDQAVEVPFMATASLPLGLWRVDATLLDGQTEVGIPKSEIVFAVINPPSTIAPDNDLTLNVGAPTDTFVKWSDATFTFTVTNHSDVEQTATVHYRLPNHALNGAPGVEYGRLQPLSSSVVVPANSAAEFTWTVPLVVAQDTVWAEIVENGARAWFNVFAIQPQVSIQVGLNDPPPYYSGQPANLVVTVTNSAPLTITPSVLVIANKYAAPWSTLLETLYQQSFAVTVPAATYISDGTIQPGQMTVTLPITPVVAPFSTWFGGTLDVRRVNLYANLLGTTVQHQTYFNLAGPLGLAAQPIVPWVPGQSGSLVVTATNILMSSSASGVITATLLDPAGLPLSVSNQTFNLAAGSQAAWTLALPMPAALSSSNYQLQLVAASGVEVMTRTLTLPFMPSMEPAQWEHTAYRAGETAMLTARLRNTSLFQPQVTITATASDLSYESVQVVTLPANGEITATFDLPLPLDLSGGDHTVELNYTASGGDTRSQTAYLSILPVELQVELEQSTVQIGEPLTLTVHNRGGARANVAYNLYLYDAHERLMASTAGQLGVLSLDATGAITWTLSDNLAAGPYLLRGEVRDQWTGRAQAVFAPLTVQGLQVDLRVGTDQDIYTVGQPITVTVDLTNTGPMLTNAQLAVRALPPAAQLQLNTNRAAMAGAYFNDLKFDTQGNLWTSVFGQGLNVLNTHGTPLDNTDDEWVSFTPENNGLTTDWLNQILIDDQNHVTWVGSWEHGLWGLEDENGPFTSGGSLGNLNITDTQSFNSVWDVTASTTPEILWLATDLGVQVRDTDGTPLVPGDDTVYTLPLTRVNGNPCDPFIAGDVCGARDIAIDQQGIKWIGLYRGGVTALNDNGTPFDPDDDEQMTFWLSPTISLTAVPGYDPVGTAPTVWISPTNKPARNVWHIVVDENNFKWFMTDGGVYVLDDNHTPFNLTDDRWQWFTPSDGLQTINTRSLWIDSRGLKWISGLGGGIGILDDANTPFDKSDDYWESYTRANGMWSLDTAALVGDPSSDTVWIGGAQETALYVAGRLNSNLNNAYWRTSQPITLTVGQTLALALPTDLLSEPGKFQVTARLLSSSQQEVAATQQDFYLFAPSSSAMARLRGLAALRLQASPLSRHARVPESGIQFISGNGSGFPLTTHGNDSTAQRLSSHLQTPTAANGVTLDVIPGVVYPEQPFTLQGTLRNLGATTQQRVLHLSQDGSEIYTLGPVTLEPGEIYTYTTAATAPVTTGLSLITARSTAADDTDPINVEEVVRTARPGLTAELQAPDVVGYDPFTMTVLLKNASFITGSVQMALGEHTETVSVGPGAIQTVPFMTQVDHNTTLIIQISGDLNMVLEYLARVGGFVGVDVLPQSVYPAGRVELPYNLVNYEGSTAHFTAFITLTSNTDFSQTLSFEATVAPYATVPGTLVFEDLPVGEYTVSALTLYVDEPQVMSFRVAPAEAVDLFWATEPTAGSWLTLTAQLTNNGAQPFDGSLALEGDLGSPVVTATLTPGSFASYPFVFDLSGVAAGTHVITVTAYNAAGQPLAVQSLALSVQGPQLTLSPTDIELTAGQTVSVSVAVENHGDQATVANLAFDFSEFASEQQQAWLEPGQTQTITYEFYLPDDLTDGIYLAHYTLSGGAQPIEGDLPITVVGIDVTVEAATDAPYYQSSDTAHLALTITNNNEASTPDLFALTRFNGQVLTQPVTFAGSTANVTFDIPVDFTTNEKVFYGLYQQVTGRGVHLNTIYLHEFNPDLTLVTDRQVYRPGDTVQVTLVTTATGNLFIVAPGYQNDLILPANGFQFDLPTALTRGTYEIEYQLTGCGCALDGQTKVYRFDVAAPQVKITRTTANLTQTSAVNLNLQVKASESLNAVLHAWVLAPDGQHGANVEQPVTLLAIPHNLLTLSVPIEDTQLGTHQVAYKITHPDNVDLVYAAGTTRFERGGVAFVNLRTLQSEYPHTTDVVELEALIYASHPITGQGELNLDGVLVREGTMALTAGTHSLTFAIPGPLTPGWHDLSVTLSADGLSETRSLRLAYGTQAADLVISAPQLTIASTGVTGTLEVFVRNAGSEDAAPTWLKLWDGAPEAEGSRSLGVAEVPALTAGEGRWFSFIWGLPLEGGLNSLYAVADIYNEVAEFHEDNNLSRNDVQVPGFTVQVDPDQPVYDPSQTATLYLTTIDLWPDRAATLDVTTTVTSGSSTTVFEDVRQIIVPVDDEVTTMVPWSLSSVSPGTYSVRVVAQEGAEQHTAFTTVQVRNFTDFTAQPLTGTAPLTVTFTDLSTPPYDIEAWNWDFGDGSSASAEQNPSHVYTVSGTFSVTLQITADGQNYQKTRPAYITVTTPAPVIGSGLAISPSWAVESNKSNAQMGYSVATAGDVNGDGYSDVIVGAPYYSNGQSNEGRAWVYLGSATGVSTTASWMAESNQNSAYFGYSVASAGDVNGDGYADIIVGAYDYSNDESGEGRAFVYLGSSTGLSTTASWTAEGNQDYAYFGQAVGGAGDVNHDGYADIIVGAPAHDEGGLYDVGRIYIYLGSNSGISTTASSILVGDVQNAFFGSAVNYAGDVNGDSYGDVIAASIESGSNGKAFVYHGSPTGVSITPTWVITGDQGSGRLGSSVGTAGDVNGDGYDDVIIGASNQANGEYSEGLAYVYLGSAEGLTTTASWIGEGNQQSARFGYAVGTAGDVNQDGYADIIVGSIQYSPTTQGGAVFVYYGSSSGLSAMPDWAAYGGLSSSNFGLSVNTAGDVNGDGYADVIIGTPGYRNGQFYEGRALVYQGQPPAYAMLTPFYYAGVPPWRLSKGIPDTAPVMKAAILQKIDQWIILAAGSQPDDFGGSTSTKLR